MGISLDGLVSHLDTTALIKALMDVEAIPRDLLRAKADDKGAIVSQLQSLNAALQELATRSDAAASGDLLGQVVATSSSSAVTAIAHAGAAPVTAELVVDGLAQRHTVVTAALADWPDEPPVLTLENAAGERIEVTAASASLADVARAVNQAGYGITASVVSAGEDADGIPLQRLQLTADRSGSGSAFRVLRGGADAVAAGTAQDVATEPGAAVTVPAADARVLLWAGTAAEQAITSETNTFTDLFPGVDVTIAAAGADPVTIAVSDDPAESAAATTDFVTQLATLLARIDKGSTATVGGETTTLGVFTGDSTVRALRQALAEAVQFPVGGVSPATIGISMDRHGVLTIDQDKLSAALADDPGAVRAIVTGVGARVQETAERYSDKYDGLLTARITGQQDEIEALGDQMDRWDVRLAQRKSALERTYAHLETMLSQLQAQSSYLTSQLAGLPGSAAGSGS